MAAGAGKPNPALSAAAVGCRQHPGRKSTERALGPESCPGGGDSPEPIRSGVFPLTQHSHPAKGDDEEGRVTEPGEEAAAAPAGEAPRGSCKSRQSRLEGEIKGSRSPRVEAALWGGGRQPGLGRRAASKSQPRCGHRAEQCPWPSRCSPAPCLSLPGSSGQGAHRREPMPVFLGCGNAAPLSSAASPVGCGAAPDPTSSIPAGCGVEGSQKGPHSAGEGGWPHCGPFGPHPATITTPQPRPSGAGGHIAPPGGEQGVGTSPPRRVGNGADPSPAPLP